nr:methionine adenosyltransferase domain-containing protein [Tepidiforma sp.]
MHALLRHRRRRARVAPSASRPSAPASSPIRVIRAAVRAPLRSPPRGAIIEDLGLRRPIYRPTAAYGHFGRTDLDLPWEDTSRAADLRAAAGR